MKECELDSSPRDTGDQTEEKDEASVIRFVWHPDAKARVDQLEAKKKIWAQYNRDTLR